MKKFSMIIPIIVLSSLIILTSCESPVDSNPIDENKPEVTNIESSTDKIPAGASIEVSVEAESADSYEWSADSGSFGNPTSSVTTWSSEGIESSSNVKLECKITNSSGSRNASVTISVVVLTEPTAYWPLDTDKADAVGSQDAVGDMVTIVSDGAKIGAGCASFPGEEGGVLQVAGSGLPTDGSADYTVMMWIKTNVVGFSVFSRTQEGGIWDWEDGNKGWGFWYDYGYPTNAFTSIEPWAPYFTEANDVWDGEWHHYAAVYFSADDSYAFYVDGEVTQSGQDGYENPTSGDFELLFTMGGNGWQGFLNGLLDDAKYYNQTLSEAEIALIASQ